VLVCDAGHPRNESARICNGFLSRDGSTHAEFLQICRDQLRRYETIELRSRPEWSMSCRKLKTSGSFTERAAVDWLRYWAANA
jgi:hypothetical protein